VDVTILGIVGSPRKGGNTEVMVRAALKAAESLGGVHTDIILMAGRKVSPCKGCHHCWFHGGVCAIKDDASEMIQKMVEADGLIVGSPVYFGSITATLKSLLERCLKLNTLKKESESMDSMAYDAIKSEEVVFPLRNKVGGAISVGGVQSGGQERVIIDIHGFFLLNDVIVVTDGGIRTPEVHPHFGGVGIGRGKKQVEKDAYGIATSQSVGLRVAEVAKLIKLGMKLSPETKAI
jgi:multimeric flavodoxin WrbA